MGVFAATRPEIDSTVTHAKRMESNDVLQAIAPALAALGYAIEQGKTKAGKLPRPVFFGDEGTFLRTYEIDSFQSETVLRWRSRQGGPRWATPAPAACARPAPLPRQCYLPLAFSDTQ